MEEALALMVDHQPDLNHGREMPVMDGVEALARMKEICPEQRYYWQPMQMRKISQCWSWSSGLPGEAFEFKPAAPVCGDTNRQFRKI